MIEGRTELQHPGLQSQDASADIELGPQDRQFGDSMNDMTTRCQSQSPADRLQERRRRTPRSTTSFSAEDTRRAGVIMARIESGEFNDEALASAIATA